MRNYLVLLEKVLSEGEWRKTRNSNVKGIFGAHLKWDLLSGFPILTTKKIKIHSVASELAWILEGSRDDNRLCELNNSKTSIWTANADSYHGDFPGDVGFIYGPLLRNFHGIDQLERIVNILEKNPTDRRMLVTMWDPSEDRQCLPTCHYAWQVYVRDNRYLDLMWIQRSVDIGLGLPYDIIHYALLTELLAQTVGLYPGRLHCSLGDVHAYEKHISQLKDQVTRVPYFAPIIVIDPKATVFNFKPEMVSLKEYESHPAIPMEFVL